MVSSLRADVQELRKEATEERRIQSSKIDGIASNGCAKAGDHDNFKLIEERVQVLELARAKNMGVMSVAMVGIGVGVELFIRWVCHALKIGG